MPEILSDISGKKINFYFLNVDISLIIYANTMNFCIHIENITAEGTVFQIFDIGPGSFCIHFRKKCLKKEEKVTRFWT